MKTVTYRGPTDPAERSDRFRIDEPESVTFPRDVPVKVSDEVAELVDGYPGHDFEVRSRASRKSNPKARQGATEEE